MKIKKETFTYSFRPTKYLALHLSKPVPHNYQLKDSKYWPIGMNNLQAPAIFNGLPVPEGLEEAQRLRDMVKKIDGIKAVYVEEYQILLEISPAVKWEDVSEQMKLTIGRFFNEEKVELVN